MWPGCVSSQCHCVLQELAPPLPATSHSLRESSRLSVSSANSRVGRGGKDIAASVPFASSSCTGCLRCALTNLAVKSSETSPFAASHELSTGAKHFVSSVYFPDGLGSQRRVLRRTEPLAICLAGSHRIPPRGQILPHGLSWVPRRYAESMATPAHGSHWTR